MANSTRELTDTQIKRAKPRAAEYNLSDGKGLQLRIKPSGTKTWLFNYSRPVTKRRTNLKLGTYPELSLRQARERRQSFRSMLADGKDPQIQLQQEQSRELEASANTLQSIADQWFEIKSHEISEDYASDLYNSLSNHIFPILGKTPIHQLRARQVISALEPLHSAGKLELVKRLCQRLNMVMDYAVIRGIIDMNPLGPIGKAFKAPKKSHLPALKPSELPELLEAIESASVTTTTRNLMMWQLHTMVRPSEAAGAKWREIDFKKSTWNIPAERMKKKRPHSVPLTAMTIEILSNMKSISGKRDFIFPSNRNPREHASSAAVNMALRRMGFKGRLVSHGFRALASTALNDQGFDPDLIESALAHADKNSVRAAYNRSDFLERRKEMMEWWSARLAICDSSDLT